MCSHSAGFPNLGLELGSPRGAGESPRTVRGSPLAVGGSAEPIAVCHPGAAFLQSAIQAAAGASVEVKNILEFYKQWKEMG